MKGWDARVMGRTGRREWTKMVDGKEGLKRVERRNREGGRDSVGGQRRKQNMGGTGGGERRKQTYEAEFISII